MGILLMFILPNTPFHPVTQVFHHVVIEAPKVSPSEVPVSQVSPKVSLSEIESDLVQRINEYRLSNNKGITKTSESTCDIATTRLAQTEEDFSHVQLSSTVKGHPGYWFENLARYYTDPQSTLVGWINSPTHKAMLLSKMTAMCVRSNGTYWVMIGHSDL